MFGIAEDRRPSLLPRPIFQVRRLISSRCGSFLFSIFSSLWLCGLAPLRRKPLQNALGRPNNPLQPRAGEYRVALWAKPRRKGAKPPSRKEEPEGAITRWLQVCATAGRRYHFLSVLVSCLLAAVSGAAEKQPDPPPHREVGKKFCPADVDREHPLYQATFDNAEVLKDWRLEGGQRMSVVDGKLVLESGGADRAAADANHLVCWLIKEMPADFLLEFSVCPQNRQLGLNIVFFNARGLNGESIFASTLQPRDGLFKQYHSGDLNNYHISYWAGDRGTANVRKNKGFQLVAVGKDLVAAGPADAFQTVQLYKRGGKIRLMVDDVISVAFDDDSQTFGPVWNHAGWIGLRQMGHTLRCRYDFLNIFPLKPANIVR